MIKKFKADLHIHSVLSPCGDLEMSPKAVIAKAVEEKLDIIAITDHNSFDNNLAYFKIAAQNNIKLIWGVEIQTNEEIHIIALFDDYDKSMILNKKIHESLLPLKNDPEYFGDQVIIDEHENIIGFEETALINSVTWSLDETLAIVRELDGFCFPSHVDAVSYSIISQLGFIPEESRFSAVGLTAKVKINSLLEKYPYLNNFSMVRNSDAHYLKDIGSGFTNFYISEPTVSEIEKATKKLDGRYLEPLRYS